jgi:hypothetical protein
MVAGAALYRRLALQCPEMRLAVIAVCAAGVASAQPLPARVRSVVAATRACEAADGGRLWKRRLDEIPFLFVVDKRMLATADPKLAGFVAEGGLWSGALPKAMAPANTSVDWAGRRWAMVMLPLPDDDADAIRLLIHEAWHVVQPAVLPLPPFEQNGAGSALLDGPDGRLWLQLEWRALAAALTTGGRAQAEKIRDALVFRQKRFAIATADERRRETLFDLYEGLAEYTGWKLSNGTPRQFAATILRDAPTRPSFVRSFPYFTGPAYAWLLDQRSPTWIAKLKQQPDLQTLLAATLPADLPIDPKQAEKAGRAYAIDELRQSEAARWQKRQRRLAELRRRFVDGATLRLRPHDLRISFDPRDQTPLGDAGTIMANLQWKSDAGGDLHAVDGALVTPDWKELRVPLGDATLSAGRLTQPLHLTQPGWTLTLPAGWHLQEQSASWLATP